MVANRNSARQAEIRGYEAAEQFYLRYQGKGEYLFDNIEFLCQLASSEDPSISAIGVDCLFGLLVERLCDSFLPENSELYYRLFAQVVQYCRSLPPSELLDAKLKEFGLYSQKDLIDRILRLKDGLQALDSTHLSKLKKVIILSRVTVGAEVAVTGVIISKIRSLAPNAEIILCCAPFMGALFAGLENFSVLPVNYQRSGNLTERLNAWINLEEIISSSISELTPQQYLIIDPDSRYTQLGLLPLCPDDNRYYFFDSRSYGNKGNKCITEYTIQWLGELFGKGDKPKPFIALDDANLELGRRVRDLLIGKSRPAKLVSLSLGVGGNDKKKMPRAFEQRLLERLIEEQGIVAMLNRGANHDEHQQTDSLISHLQANGVKTAIIDHKHHVMNSALQGARVIVWDRQLEGLCTMISISDLFIGYDSAGSHIAAAMGVPIVEVFAQNEHPLFNLRWKPYTDNYLDIIPISHRHAEEKLDEIETVLERIGQSITRALMLKGKQERKPTRHY